MDISDLVAKAALSGDQISEDKTINIYPNTVTIDNIPFPMNLFSISSPYKINIPVEYAEGGAAGAGIFASTGNNSFFNGFGITGNKAEMQSLFQWLNIKKVNVMIFSNGYRSWDKLLQGSFLEFPPTNNQLDASYSRSYWEGLDQAFKNIRKPTLSFYVDGHHSITTSNHIEGGVGTSITAFALQFEMSLEAKNIPISPCYHVDSPTCVPLDKTPNVGGFNERVANGRIAAGIMIDKIKSMFNPTLKVEYTIDIVAHSMGFAYAQGIIEVLQNSRLPIKWDGYYIIAPENGCNGVVNPSQWEQIWQYGTNETTTPRYEQDGIAPQCAVIGLENTTSTYGRAYIPLQYSNGDAVPIGFLNSHSISNYGWIFDGTLTEGRAGYVTKK